MSDVPRSVYTNSEPEVITRDQPAAAIFPPHILRHATSEQSTSIIMVISDIPSLIKHEANIPMVRPQPAWCVMRTCPYCHEAVTHPGPDHELIISVQSKNNSFL